jgi:hypothetical protein
MMTRIFGPEEDEVTEGWRKLYNEGLHNSQTLPHTVCKMRWAARIAHMGTIKIAYISEYLKGREVQTLVRLLSLFLKSKRLFR